MGTFNTATVQTRCPHCRLEAMRALQFRFGEVWQHVYRQGDALRWGKPQVGAPEDVAWVLAYPEDGCAGCGEDDDYFEMRVERGVIGAAIPCRDIRVYQHDRNFVKEDE